jgi:hypothetical protein
MIDLDDTVELSELHAQVMPFVGGCPAPLVNLAIVRAAKEFFRRTQLLVAEVENFEDTGVSLTYKASNLWDSYLRPERILSVSMDGVEQSQSQLTAIATDTIKLTKAAEEGATISGMLVFSLLDAAEELPAAVVVDHGEALADGALAFLFTIPRKPWFDVQQAAFYADRFDRKIGRQIIEQAQAYGNNNLTIERLV